MNDTTLLYDVKQKKVGCVLLQAVYGGDSSVAQRIGAEDWFVAPTPDMQLFRLTSAQVEQLVAFHSRVKPSRRAEAASVGTQQETATTSVSFAPKN